MDARRTVRSADDPLGRFRSGWRALARKARDSWAPGTFAMEAALEETFREGVRFAAEQLEKDGHPELALRVRARMERRYGCT